MTDNGGRVRRPIPERTEPDRTWGNAVGGAGRGEAGRGGEPSAGTAERRDASYQAVNDAYRVIDDYMRQGQRLAERFWLPTAGDGPGSELSRIFERFMRSAGEMGIAWLEMVGQGSSPPRRTEPATGGAGPFAAGLARESVSDREENTGASHAPCLAVEVDSGRRVRVRVDLFDGDETHDLHVLPLAAADRTAPPLDDVGTSSELGRTAVTVRVPDGQPPGVYSGVLVDAHTHRPRGTVSVSLMG